MILITLNQLTVRYNVVILNVMPQRQFIFAKRITTEQEMKANYSMKSTAAHYVSAYSCPPRDTLVIAADRIYEGAYEK